MSKAPSVEEGEPGEEAACSDVSCELLCTCVISYLCLTYTTHYMTIHHINRSGCAFHSHCL